MVSGFYPSFLVPLFAYGFHGRTLWWFLSHGRSACAPRSVNRNSTAEKIQDFHSKIEVMYDALKFRARLTTSRWRKSISRPALQT